MKRDHDDPPRAHGEAEAGFPSVYIDSGGELETFIGSDEMNATETLDDLMELVGERLEERNLE